MKNFLFLFLLSICFSCSDAPEPAFTPEPGFVPFPTRIEEGTLDYKTELLLNVWHLEKYNDHFNLEAVYKKGTELWVEVSYGGGCKAHDFLVVWPGNTTQGYPAELVVTLYHNGNDDLCRAYIHKTVKINLAGAYTGKYDWLSILQMPIKVVNGSKPDESISIP